MTVLDMVERILNAQRGETRCVLLITRLPPSAVHATLPGELTFIQADSTPRTLSAGPSLSPPRVLALCRNAHSGFARHRRDHLEAHTTSSSWSDWRCTLSTTYAPQQRPSSRARRVQPPSSFLPFIASQGSLLRLSLVTTSEPGTTPSGTEMNLKACEGGTSPPLRLSPVARHSTSLYFAASPSSSSPALLSTLPHPLPHLSLPAPWLRKTPPSSPFATLHLHLLDAPSSSAHGTG